MRPRLRICLMISLILLLAAFPFHSTASAAVSSYEPGQIVVKLAPLAGNDLPGIQQTYGTTMLASLPHHSDTFLLQAPLGASVERLVQLMASDVRLLYAELNYINESPEDGSTDRIYGWGGMDGSTMRTQDSTKKLQLESAHAFSRGQGTLVAILDTGLQTDHPAVSDSIMPGGYDFVDNDLSPQDEANGLDDDLDGRVDELYGHGTHIAGIVHLLAPEAQLLPLRVLNSDGRGNNFRTASAILYAAHLGADAINLSLGTPYASALLRDAVNEAARLGTVVVAAAGNLDREEPQYPAAEACAIAVTSVNGNDKKSSFSNYGSWIGVAAPGENIYSAFPVDGYAWWSGTSMATPFVTGQAVLLRSANPQLSLQETGQLIGGTASLLDQRNAAYSGKLGDGRVDLLASLETLAAGDRPGRESRIFMACAP